ncbi:zinc finger MYND domain-containing protein 11-like isoform X1 [Clavelina lepadiformis]|uniref:Zinc finger MYND domain-containing protein 11 n=1 Tax=Clavelina lepadiformis TaxID=159417 RepID=A0ABP0FYM7_CLALP
MEEADVRRASNPEIVLHLYNAITAIRAQRQIANIQRLVKYLEREYGHEPKQTLYYIHDAVMDGLVIETLTVGCKGSKAGVEQEGYWIPSDEQMAEAKAQESHDWYCFICHNPGEVIPCGCRRVFHLSCLSKSQREVKDGVDWTCPHCPKVEENLKEQHELGKCLSFIISQEKNHLSDLKKKPSQEISRYYDFFVFRHYDLKMLVKDCEDFAFSSVQEFEGKLKLMIHNYAIVFGRKHRLTKLAQQLYDECGHELEELHLCQNCFFLSNEKPVDDWFCRPCEPPHQVVWAKQKGFEYWPAKVIQVKDNRVDVRFFGKHHPRAWISIDLVRAITVSPTELKIKQKVQWKEANDEMKEYLRQCECVFGEEKTEKIIDHDSPFGIGKNMKLLAAMESDKKRIGTRLSATTSQTDKPQKRSAMQESTPGSPAKSAAHCSAAVSKAKPMDGLSFEDALKTVNFSKEFMIFSTSEDEPCCSSQIPGFSNENCSSEEQPCSSKEISKMKPELCKTASTLDIRTSTLALENIEESCNMIETDIIDCQSSVVEVKQLKKKYSVVSDAHTQTLHTQGGVDKEVQASPSDLDGKECSCKMRYGMVLLKFRDYVYEHHKLEKEKLLQAVLCESTEEQKKLVEKTRQGVTLKYEEIMKKLKETHDKEIEEVKKKKWCEVCQKEAIIHCCRNANYCSMKCKTKHQETADNVTAHIKPMEVVHTEVSARAISPCPITQSQACSYATTHSPLKMRITFSPKHGAISSLTTETPNSNTSPEMTPKTLPTSPKPTEQTPTSSISFKSRVSPHRTRRATKLAKEKLISY